MPTTFGTLNNKVYTDTDFNATNYANRSQQLIGDIFESIYDKTSFNVTGSTTIGTGSKVFTVVNNLTSQISLDVGPGAWVYIRPTSVIQGVHSYMQNYMLGVVTAVTTNSITVNVIIAHGAGTFTAYNISLIGDIITTLTNPMDVTHGGTANTTTPTARSALGIPDPSAQAEVLQDDFMGQFLWDGISQYQGEQFSFNLSPTNVDFNAAVGLSGGIFYQQPQGFVPGDIVPINYDPHGVKPTINTWAAHPGCIALGVQNAGGAIFMNPAKTYFNPPAGMNAANFWNYIQFPYSNDVFEFQFMIPVGLGFNDANPGGFCIGFAGVGAGYDTLFCVGSADPALANATLGSATPTVAQFPVSSMMGAYVISADIGVNAGVFIDAGPQTGLTILQEGVWYKVRITNNVCTIYQNGTVTLATISGWTPPSMGTTKSSRFYGAIKKSGGAKLCAVVFDYVYYRHPVSR